MSQHFETLQLHAGQEVEKPHGPRAPPIYATTSYVFDNSKHAAQICNLEAPGYIYSRIMNPTNDVFEKRMAALEGGASALSVSSGQAAQFLAITGLAHTGDNIIATSCLYGGSYNQFKVTLKRLGIEARFVNGDDPEEFAKLIDSKTKAIYFESIGNPKYNIPDIERIVKVAHENGIPVVTDNTFGAGGYLVSPIKHGVDIVVHSATKWIGGHGTTIAGVIIDSGNFPWKDYPRKFPQFSEPSESYHGLILNEVFKNEAFIGHVRIDLLRDMGSCLNPFGAFLLLQGLETLSLRVERQSYNTQRLAEYLQDSIHVSWVSYVGLPSHGSHALAKKYFNHSDKFGGILSFGVKSLGKESVESSPEVAARVVDNLELASNLANVGDSKTLVISPYYTTHQQLSEQEKIACGVSEDLIRVSVGTEHIDDIISDFEKSFNIVYG